MARAYFPVLMLLGFVVMNGLLIIAISTLTIRARPTPVKQQAYESGVPALGDARERLGQLCLTLQSPAVAMLRVYTGAPRTGSPLAGHASVIADRRTTSPVAPAPGLPGLNNLQSLFSIAFGLREL